MDNEGPECVKRDMSAIRQVEISGICVHQHKNFEDVVIEKIFFCDAKKGVSVQYHVYLQRRLPILQLSGQQSC